MKNIFLIITLFIFCTGFSFAQTTQPSTQPTSKTPVDQGDENYKDYKKANYSIQYPADWTVDDTGMMGTKFILFSPQSNPQDDFKENVNFMIQDLQGMPITLDQFVEMSEAQMPIMLTNGKVLESERIQSDGKEMHKMVYTATQGTYDLKFIGYFFLEDGKAYITTFTAKVSEYDDYKDQAEKILQSFKTIDMSKQKTQKL